MDKKCNSRYISFTFASEVFQRDQPHLCRTMKLQNKKGKKLKPTKTLEKALDHEAEVSPSTQVQMMPAMVFKPVPQLYPSNQIMMIHLGPHPGLPRPRTIPPTYPPPPQQYPQWQIPPGFPCEEYIPPPFVHQPQPHVPPNIIYHGQVDGIMLQPPASPPVIHQSPPVPKKPQNKRAKNEPKNDALRDKLSGVETELKTEYKQKAEAAVAMMDLAQCSFSYRGQVIAE